MTENEIFTALRQVLLEGFTDLQVDGDVKRNYQPTKQGANSKPTVYFSKVSQRRYGFLQRDDIPNGDVMRRIEKQLYETIIRFTGQLLEGPSTSYTSSDLLDDTAFVLQRDKTRLALRDKGIGLQRITDIRHVFNIDEQDKYQSTPSFDITITHYQIKETTSPIIYKWELHQHRV